jgi:Uma2 family endonuclease
MTVTLLDQPPRTLPRSLGPYRRSDYMALPDEPRCELLYGRFYLSPSPLAVHQIIVGHLFRLFADVADRTDGVAMVAPMDVHLVDHSVVQPDVLFISRQRRELIENWVEGPPDLLVEVLSPGTASRDRVYKLNLYREHGVGEYWVVDPKRRRISFLVREGEDFVERPPDDSIYRSAAVPEIELDTDALWAAVDRVFRKA